MYIVTRMEMGRYYSPSGERRARIKEEIVEAIAIDPHQDPSVTVERKREGPVSSHDHLDIVVPLIEMVRTGDVSYSPKEGWKSNIESAPEPTSSVV